MVILIYTQMKGENMKLDKLTLEQFQDYIFENLESEINFQLPKDIKELTKDEFLNERFELTKNKFDKQRLYSFLTFRIYIRLEYIDEINLSMVKSLFEGFIKKYDIEIKGKYIDLGFYCTFERQFELELMLYTENWIPKQPSK